MLRTTAPPENRPLLPKRMGVWCIVGLVAAVVLSWASVQLQLWRPLPLGLVSLLLGVALGGVLMAAMYLLGWGRAVESLVLGAVFALLAASLQHVWIYQAHRAQQAAALREKAQAGVVFQLEERGPVSGFFRFMQAEAHQEGAVLLWVLDAMLIVAATVAVIRWLLKKPYAPCCRHWYHTIWQARLDDIQQVALRNEMPAQRVPAQASYRDAALLGCRCGAGPLALVLTKGQDKHQVWIVPENRPQLERLLRPAETSSNETTGSISEAVEGPEPQDESPPGDRESKEGEDPENR